MNTDAETYVPPVEAPPSRRRLGLPRSPKTLAIVILIALVLAEAVLLVRGDPKEGARADVLQTSQRFAVLLTTYNADTLATQRAEILPLTGADFLAALRERQADSKGRVVKIAITSLEGDDAVALAVVEVTTTNKDRTTPGVEQNVIELSLVRGGGGWRIDAVSILGTIG
jgi:hypothetical protein